LAAQGGHPLATDPLIETAIPEPRVR
jgi:hypothetical protein